MTEAQQLRQNMQQRAADVVALKALWQALLPLDLPPETQFQLWLELHNFGTLAQALRETSKKYHKLFQRGQRMDADHTIRFASAVAVARAAKK